MHCWILKLDEEWVLVLYPECGPKGSTRFCPFKNNLTSCVINLVSTLQLSQHPVFVNSKSNVYKILKDNATNSAQSTTPDHVMTWSFSVDQ